MAGVGNPEEQPQVPVSRGLRRVLYLVLGTSFVGLAVLGALLPILPTTPFLLLASYFYLRSAPGLNERLLRSRLFGQLLRDWQQHRGVRLHVKVTAVAMMGIAVGGSAYFGNLSLPFLILLGVLALIGVIVVLRLPRVRDDKKEPRPGASIISSVPPTARLVPEPDESLPAPS